MLVELQVLDTMSSILLLIAFFLLVSVAIEFEREAKEKGLV